MLHILFTLKGCNRNVINNKSLVEQSISIAARVSKSTLLGMNSHHFHPQGVTCVALLAESHISVHTWPELGLAICDVFTCGEKCEPMDAALHLKAAFDAEDIDFTTVNRSIIHNL
jgi:S-adenosylmethionine decarboxylase